MLDNILAFLPVAFLIVYAVRTKKMAEAMVLAALLAMVLLHRTNFLSGTIGDLYDALADPSYHFVLLIMMGFGGMITLLQKSGALLGFGTSSSKWPQDPSAPWSWPGPWPCCCSWTSISMP